MKESGISDYAGAVIPNVEDAFLRQALQSAWAASDKPLSRIEAAFQHLSEGRLDSYELRQFFHSWSQTNNSASTLAGYCNRLSSIAISDKAIADSRNFLDIIHHLNRVTDEDLGANGGTLHWDLFYRMASTFCQGDEWLSLRYRTPQASEFKRWKEQKMLREPDLMQGMLVTLIHEISTHGEVEFILPLFEHLLAQMTELSPQKRSSSITWIKVHCGATEKNHFFHTLQAARQLCNVMEYQLDQNTVCDIFCDYLQRKADVMESISIPSMSSKLG